MMTAGPGANIRRLHYVGTGNGGKAWAKLGQDTVINDLDIKFRLTSLYKGKGVFGNSSVIGWYYNREYINSIGAFSYYFDGKPQLSLSNISPYDKLTRITYSRTSGVVVCYIDGVQRNRRTVSIAATAIAPLFGREASHAGIANAKLYESTINGVVYTPVEMDGKIGFWCDVDGMLYESISGTPFVAGPEI